MLVTLPQRHGRSTVTLHDHFVVKQHHDRARFVLELDCYRTFRDSAPKLFKWDRETLTLTIERLPLACDLPEWKPVAQLRALLERLEARGVHHRDVHTKNIVRAADGSPLLIDWETAIVAHGCPSYDLFGPEVSGISKPVEHTDYAAQWWDAGTRWSIGRAWEGKA